MIPARVTRWSSLNADTSKHELVETTWVEWFSTFLAAPKFRGKFDHPGWSRVALATALRKVDVFFADGDDDEATIEDVGAELRRRAGAGPSLLIVDSIQTARALGSKTAPSRREAIDAVVAAGKVEAKRGSLVVMTSEVGRAWYRATKDRIDPLAAFKESGGIEYGLALGLVLLEVEGVPGTVDVFTAKNRIGTAKPIFRLRQDFARASFGETARDDAPADAPSERDVRADVLRALSRFTRTTSARALADIVKGRKATVMQVIKELRAEGAIVTVDGCLRAAVEAA